MSKWRQPRDLRGRAEIALAYFEGTHAGLQWLADELQHEVNAIDLAAGNAMLKYEEYRKSEMGQLSGCPANASCHACGYIAVEKNCGLSAELRACSIKKGLYRGKLKEAKRVVNVALHRVWALRTYVEQAWREKKRRADRRLAHVNMESTAKALILHVEAETKTWFRPAHNLPTDRLPATTTRSRPAQDDDGVRP